MSEHWLRHAHGRIVAGDSEPDVLADYGWVCLTAEEREALDFAADFLDGRRVAEVLRNLLERLK